MQMESFLADIGGTVGLWLGVSVISGIEVLQVIVEIARYLYRKTRQPMNR